MKTAARLVPQRRHASRATDAASAPGSVAITRELDAVSAAIDRMTFEAGRADTRRPTAGSPLVTFQRIVLAVDGSPASNAAITWARDLGRTFGAHVWVLGVVPNAPLFSINDVIAGEWDRSNQENARIAVREAATRLRKAEVACATAVAQGNPVNQIAQFATAHEADLVIVGSHRRTKWGRFFLGSVAEGVKDHAPCAVLIARRPPPLRHVLVGVDGSHESRRAASYGLRLAAIHGVPTTILHALSLLGATHIPGADERREIVGRALAFPMPNPDAIRYAIAFGDAAIGLLSRAQEDDVDLIVVGARGLGAFRSRIPGRTSSLVAQAADCSVLVLKAGPEA